MHLETNDSAACRSPSSSTAAVRKSAKCTIYLISSSFFTSIRPSAVILQK
jgi:hypothetical protein